MKHAARWALLLTLVLVARGRVLEFAETSFDSIGASAWWRAADVLFSGPAAMALFLFSRLDVDDVASQATRTRMRELVRDRPGIGLSEVAAALGLGWGTTVYHANRLESAGLLVSGAAGRKRALFLPEHGRVTRGAVTVLHGAATVRLLRLIQERPGASQRELADAANLSAPLAHRHLRRLEDEGLVASQKTWRTRSYSPTSALEDYVQEHTLRRMSATVAAADAASAKASVGGTDML